MTEGEKSALRELAEKCKSKGCLCLRRCYVAFGKYWREKAAICNNPNVFKPDERK